MKTREELILETINFERLVMKFKRENVELKTVINKQARIIYLVEQLSRVGVNEDSDYLEITMQLFEALSNLEKEK